MNDDIDALLTEVQELSARIDAGPADDPATDELVLRRDELRRIAHHAALDRRHPKSVETEIERLEQRLSEIAAMLITKGYSEKYVGKTIQDPGAYSHTINELIGQEHRKEVADITERLTELRSIDPDGDGS